MLGEDPWARFSREVDYRMGVSTKPHRAHPNYVFYVGEEIWATRFQQKDAVCVANPSRRIAIGGEHIHDGVLHDGLLYFTRVDGQVVVANPATLRVEGLINLNSMADESTLLGWCRGILFEDSLAWIGFTRIRPTRFREAVSWVRQGFQRALPTHVACYDLVRRRCLAEVDLETHGLNAVFSIFLGAEVGGGVAGGGAAPLDREIEGVAG